MQADACGNDHLSIALSRIGARVYRKHAGLTVAFFDGSLVLRSVPQRDKFGPAEADGSL
jgi:hypothetical protein